jgi:hypothetical protein
MASRAQRTRELVAVLDIGNLRFGFSFVGDGRWGVHLLRYTMSG